MTRSKKEENISITTEVQKKEERVMYKIVYPETEPTDLNNAIGFIDYTYPTGDVILKIISPPTIKESYPQVLESMTHLIKVESIV